MAVTVPPKVAVVSSMEDEMGDVTVGGEAVPVPWMSKLYGFSSLSSLAMLTVPVLSPAELGVNRTVNVVVPPPEVTGVEGNGVIRLKSAPVTVT
ncbi:MAG: hypothetical protein OEM90_11095 [Desulfobacteraceae bacterium]|nr:hypothetical protein [Desulfobacteraceae bacterium]